MNFCSKRSQRNDDRLGYKFDTTNELTNSETQ